MSRPLHFAAFVMNTAGHEDLDTPVGELRTEGVQSIVGWIKDLIPDRPATLRDVAHYDRLPERHPAARYRGAFAPQPSWGRP